MDELNTTIVAATLDGFEATALTLASLKRTASPKRVLVADNGSTDGTLELLDAVPWVEVVPLKVRLEFYPGEASSDLTRHGPTLDWLVAQCDTPFVLTLDSDVEFHRRGWLRALLGELSPNELDAVGELDAGVEPFCPPRIQPHVALFRRHRLMDLACTFSGASVIASPEEIERWHARGNRVGVAMDEAASYRTAVFYDTGALLLEAMRQGNYAYGDTPQSIRSQYTHVGHMSWAGAEGEFDPEGSRQSAHAHRLAYVRRRLLEHDLGRLLGDAAAERVCDRLLRASTAPSTIHQGEEFRHVSS